MGNSFNPGDPKFSRKINVLAGLGFSVITANMVFFDFGKQDHVFKIPQTYLYNKLDKYYNINENDLHITEEEKIFLHGNDSMTKVILNQMLIDKERENNNNNNNIYINNDDYLEKNGIKKPKKIINVQIIDKKKDYIFPEDIEKKNNE